MTYFWTIQEHVPDGLGFRLFGIAHLLWLGGIVLAGSLSGGLKWWYYPAPGGATGAQAALWTAAFVLLAAFPLIFDAKEAIQWRASRSRT